MPRLSGSLGWRAMIGLLCCGAATGFALPAIASSLTSHEGHQRSVRILPLPRVPTDETQLPIPPVSSHPTPYGGRPIKPLSQRQLKQENPAPGPLLGTSAGPRGSAPTTEAPAPAEPKQTPSKPSNKKTPNIHTAGSTGGAGAPAG
jgi:hypothetical protein